MFADLFPLDIFPPGSLSSSVIVTVWVGVFVVATMNLRLGWVLSGLVVPGYVVPLLLVKPWSAVVVLFESIIAYYIVRFLSDVCSRWGLWGSFFGRDRFFAIVLASILVRIVSDLWALPLLGEYLQDHWDIHFDYRANLQSFGLIIIALIANLYWKTGFVRGMIPLFFGLGVTYLIVRFGLMEFTNYSVANLSFMYEDIAASVEASPKAYIILLTVAYMASHMNLRYGWDFNGILIPSLLALQWYQPFKIFTSFLEAFLIVGLATVLLKLPPLKSMSIEGGRKLLFFFNISFVYKFILGYLLLWFLPEFKATDYYGYGYLLPTLIAIKMHDKGILLHLSRTTLHISITGVATASIIGFVMSQLMPGLDTPKLNNSANIRAIETSRSENLMETLLQDKISLYRSRFAKGMPVPLPAEAEIFRNGVKRLNIYVNTGDSSDLNQASQLLANVRYQVIEVADAYVYLREFGEPRGWGTYALSLKPQNRMLLQIPAPMEESGTIEAGGWLFQQLGAKALAIAGTRQDLNPDGSANVLQSPTALFAVFQRALSSRDNVQLRRYTPATRRSLAGIAPDATALVPRDPNPALWISNRLAEGLDLVRLDANITGLELNWRPAPLSNKLRESSTGAFNELFLDRDAIRRLLARPILDRHPVDLQIAEQRVEGYLQKRLLDTKDSIAGKGSNAYQPPGLEQLLFFDEEIITPLLSAIRNGYVDSEWTEEGLSILRTIDAAATLFGYELIRYRHRSSGQDYILLAEKLDAPSRNYWGTYAFRLGASEDLLVAIPRPLYELNSFEFGVSLFERGQGAALLIGGSHPLANTDGSADLTRESNKVSLFALVQQALMREWEDRPLLLAHSRAFGYQPDRVVPQADIILAPTPGTVETSLQFARLNELIEESGLSSVLTNGAPASAGYEVGSSVLSRYAQIQPNKYFTNIWVSPVARKTYRQQADNQTEQTKFAAAGLSSIELDLSAELAERGASANAQLPIEAIRLVEQYARTRDIVLLSKLQSSWPNLRWQRVIDINSQQAYLIGSDMADAVVAIANLDMREDWGAQSLNPKQFNAQVIQKFVDTRSSWLKLDAEE